MINLTGVTHHPALEEIVEVVCAKTQNTDKGFYRVAAAFFLAKMAAVQRVTVLTKDRGEIPVNVYAIALATSGYGKGHSVNIFEDGFLGGFSKEFMGKTFPALAEARMSLLAEERALIKGTEQEVELDKLMKAFDRTGPYLFTFDSGTSPAVKQMRNKLLMADAGAINFQMDEVGSNIENNLEVFTTFLELFDQGLSKQKLTKNTSDSQRDEDMFGKTPANMLAFGTYSRLLDGGPTETAFYSLLETGYARRCLFAWGETDRKASHQLTPEEIYRNLIQSSNNVTVTKWSDHFIKLADPAFHKFVITMEDDEAIKLIEYKVACEKAADLLPDQKEIEKAELSHRYFKALKLAGTFAFIDRSCTVTMTHLLQAILLVEESGAAFKKIINREKSYVKLARFFASEPDNRFTHADLHEALPFYKTGMAARAELMSLAIAWGYKNNIIIQKTFEEGIEFYQGKSLKETNMDEMMLSVSTHEAFHYTNVVLPWDELAQMVKTPIGTQEFCHWANHWLEGGANVDENGIGNGHRAELKVHPGFNMIVLDVDGGASLAQVQDLLQQYRYMMYTTKRHQTDGVDRFRVILPANYVLELDAADYTAFMEAIADWLPFEVDDTHQRSKKWLTNDGEVFVNDGELFDVLRFVPKTTRHEEHKNQQKAVASMDAAERWFAERIASGNRNNQMIKFALFLVDSGYTDEEVSKAVHSFNKKLSNGLPASEIDSTIMKTVARKCSERE